jgi:hypothetical protein
LQEEQEEIMKARASSQKRLSIKEIKKMVYLSQVIILGVNLSLTHFLLLYGDNFSFIITLIKFDPR